MKKDLSEQWKTRYKHDVLLAIIIVVIPFVLSLHLLFDNESNNLRFDLFGHAFVHKYHNDSAFVWSVFVRIIPIVLFSIWFFNNSFRRSEVVLLAVFPFANALFDPIFLKPLAYFWRILIAVGLLAFLMVIRRKMENKFQSRSLPFVKLKMGRAKLLQKIRQVWIKEVFDTKSYHKLKKLLHLKKVLESEYGASVPSYHRSVVKQSTERVVFFLLVIIFIMYFLYLLIPEGVMKIDLGLFYLKSYGFPDVHTLIWYMSVKLCVLIPLCIWFVTCPFWWKFSILSPIVLYAYQLWQAFQPENDTVDHYEYLSSLPYLLFLILLLYIISRTMKYTHEALDLYQIVSQQTDEIISEAMENELSPILTGEKLKFLKSKTTEANLEEQLEKLISLREELERKVRKEN